MTSRKTHSRRHGSHAKSSLSAQVHQNGSFSQQQYAFQPSDYESDSQYLSEQLAPTAMPPVTARTVDEVNLLTLRRYNPAIRTILSKASYAVVYVFSPSTSSWEKNGVEGTLFVCQLEPGPIGEDRYNVIILNRRGLENFEAQLLDEGDVEITDEYVILNVKDEGSSTDQTQKVYGLWIFCEPPPSSTSEARIENATKMKECATYAEHSRHEALAAISQHHLHGSDGTADDPTMARQPQQGLQQNFKQPGPPDQAGAEYLHNQGYSANGLRNHSAQAVAGQQEPYNMTQQSDILGNLFRKAGL